MSQAGMARIGKANLPPSVPLQFTGNTGVSVPVANNENIVTANATVKFVGSGSTLTEDFGKDNLVLGQSLVSLTSGNLNVGLGNLVLTSLTSGNANTAVGYGAANSLLNGGSNVAIGTGALTAATSSISNIAIGVGSLQAITTSTGSNTSLGNHSLDQLVTGASCIGIGASAGTNYTGAESSNIVISNAGTAAESHVIRIGTQGSGAGQQTDCYLAGILHTTSGRTKNITAPGAYPYTVLSTDNIISVNTGVAHTINLPNAPSTGTTYILKDVTGTAAANNITVTTPGGTVTIDGATSRVMSTNYASLQVYFNGTSYFII